MTNSEQAAGIKMRELVAGRGDDSFNRVRKGTGADGCPVVVAKTDAAAHEVIRDLQIIIVRTIEVGEIDGGRIRESKIANRIVFGEDDDRASTADLSLQRRRRGCRDKETRKRTQETGCRDIEF